MYPSHPNVDFADDLSMFLESPYLASWGVDSAARAAPQRGGQETFGEPESNRLDEQAFLGSFMTDSYLFDAFDLPAASSANRGASASASTGDQASALLSSSSSHEFYNHPPLVHPSSSSSSSSSTSSSTLSDASHAAASQHQSAASLHNLQGLHELSRASLSSKRHPPGPITTHHHTPKLARLADSAHIIPQGPGGLLQHTPGPNFLAPSAPSIPPKALVRDSFRPDQMRNDFELVLDKKVPKEIRTGSTNEPRSFRVTARLVGDWHKYQFTHCTASLRYRPTNGKGEGGGGGLPIHASPSPDILGGDTKVPVVHSSGAVLFTNLTLKEASTRHQERLFAIDLTLHTQLVPNLSYVRRTSGFYGYTHRKVLSRRENVVLRKLSQSYGCMEGGEEIFLIGYPFVKGPQFQIQINTPHGQLVLKSQTNVEFISQNLVSFNLPPYPDYWSSHRLHWTDGFEVRCELVVSNDGRNHSGSLPFFYVVGSGLGATATRTRHELIEQIRQMHTASAPSSTGRAVSRIPPTHPNNQII